MNTAGTLLMERNPDFLAMVGQWERDKSPFLGASDKFEEWGMTGQAAGWRWASTWQGGACPDVYRFRRVGRRRLVPAAWYWRQLRVMQVAWEDLDIEMRRSILPGCMFHDSYGHPDTGRMFPTFRETIAWFLDRWVEVYGNDDSPVIKFDDTHLFRLEALPMPLVHRDFSFTLRQLEQSRMVPMEIPISPNFQPSLMGVMSTDI